MSDKKIPVECPNCSTIHEVPISFRGKKGSCNECGFKFVIAEATKLDPPPFTDDRKVPPPPKPAPITNKRRPKAQRHNGAMSQLIEEYHAEIEARIGRAYNIAKISLVGLIISFVIAALGGIFGITTGGGMYEATLGLMFAMIFGAIWLAAKMWLSRMVYLSLMFKIEENTRDLG